MKAYLVLANGQIFEGERIGSEKSVVGELVFNTSVVGYMETLTDQRYTGQIVMQTFPMIGNYGVISEDLKSPCAVKAYVAREISETASNFRCDGKLDEYLAENDIPGITGVDTRAITRILRSEGTMNAALVSSPDEVTVGMLASYRVGHPEQEEKTPVSHIAENERAKAALIDYGAPLSAVEDLLSSGISVTVYPATVTADEIMAGGFDGAVLSSGAGDPREFEGEIGEIAKLAGKLPIFGFGLGHQLLAIALGGKVEKLPFGHRGSNQPVRDDEGQRTYITSQNHGYAVAEVPAEGKIRYENANDNTCEGVDYEALGAFSVQFAPKKSKGPHDMTFLYDRFIKLMEV